MEWIGTSWQWVMANGSVIGALATVVQAVIWAVYLQLLLHNFNEARKPEMIINRCKGHDLNAHCLVSNMSTNTAAIESIIVRLRSGDQVYYADVTDVGTGLDGKEQNVIDPDKLRYATRQGPIKQGDCLDAGRFGFLIQRVADLNGLTLDENLQPQDEKPFTRIEVLTINIYGRQRHPVGACRSFAITHDQHGGYFLEADKPMTRQLISRRERQEIEKWKAALDDPGNTT